MESIDSAEVIEDSGPPLSGLGTELDDTVPFRFPLTDLGNAERLVARYGADLRYVFKSRHSLLWTGQRWQEDVTGEIMRLAARTVRQIPAEANWLADPEQREGLLKWALASESRSRLLSMVKLAQNDAGIAITSPQLDANPWLLNCENGTINLRTADLLSHRREDLLTKLAPVVYDSAAACPLWEAFLERIMDGNARLIGFLQRAVGYALTGDTREQLLFMLYGTGANGKSTFLETIRAALGDYAQQTDFSTFLARNRDGIRNDVARLDGARFVSAVEAESNRRLAEVLIKQVTGADTITARFLFREFFEFVPHFKLFLATNHKPVIQGTDHAIWRRIRLIPFRVTIPDEEQDKQLPKKLRTELPGILAWAVRGCRAWQCEGLGVPPEVMEATSAYRQEMDVLNTFISERCVQGPHLRVTVKELYAGYLAWCQQTGEVPLTPKAFGLCLEEKGFHADKAAQGVRIRRGLTLMASQVADGGTSSSGKECAC